MSLSDKMGNCLGIDSNYIKICSKRNNLYAKYYIPKKNGERREILQPSKELKVLQRWLVRNIFNEFPVSEFSSAYSKGNSVKRNAMQHKESNYICHTDIKDFFPSITRETMKRFFDENRDKINALELYEEDLELIMDICLYKGEKLVVGSVASPKIANIIMYKFDKELDEELSKIGNFIYTRYADDIVISSKKFIDKKVLNVIDTEMQKHGFRMNRKKTYFMNKSCKRKITGVVIDNNCSKLTIGNSKYKEIQREIYNFLIKGEGSIGHIKGYLAYMKDISNEQYMQLERIYKEYDRKHLLF